MSMMFNASRALEMEQHETQDNAYLSNVRLFASTVRADDFSADRAGRRAPRVAPGRGDVPTGRSKFDRDQLEALRRSVEEGCKRYRSLPWFQKRNSGSPSFTPGTSTSRQAAR